MSHSRRYEPLLPSYLLPLLLFVFLLLLSACSTPLPLRPTLPEPPPSLTQPLRPLPPVPTVQARYWPDGSPTLRRSTRSAATALARGRHFMRA